MFLDFYDNCDTSSLPSSLDTLADTCRGTVRTAMKLTALLLPIDAAWPHKCRLRSSIAATADETAPPTPNASHPSTAATPASAARA